MGQNFASLASGNWRDLPSVLNVSFVWKANFEKNTALPFEKLPSLILPRNAIMVQHPTSNFSSVICQVTAHRRLNTKGNFKLLVLEVVVIAYERWSLKKSSKYHDWLRNFWYFWKTGCWGKVIAYDKWLQVEVEL